MVAAAGCGFGSFANVGKCPGILAPIPQGEHRCTWGARYFATADTGATDKALGEATQGGCSQLDYPIFLS